ncbi:MAG TPA: hypothetical protein VHE81_20065, partial [Lacipirellulaceae bacterium]|nr:hypothetical protein [Lacipirellulaceae bacterium]
MKVVSIVVICLLICRPIFGHEHENTSGSMESSAHSETEVSEMEGDDDGNESRDMESVESTESDDHNNDMNMNNENESDSDEMDSDKPSSTSGIGGATNSIVLKNSQKPLLGSSRSAGAIANAKQLIDHLPSAESGEVTMASATLQASAGGGSVAAGNVAAIFTNAPMMSAKAPVAGTLSFNV